MPITRPDEYRHTNPDLAFVDNINVRGARLVVSTLSDLYLLKNTPDKLKEDVTVVRVLNVLGEPKEYLLIDIDNAQNSSGWIEYSTGGASELSLLTDTQITSPVNEEVLIYDTSLPTPKWTNKLLSIPLIQGLVAALNSKLNISNLATEVESEITSEPVTEENKWISLKILQHWWSWVRSNASRFRLSFLANATTNPRLTQVDSDGEISAPEDNLVMDGFITDIDVIAAIVTATYNLSNAYTVAITPANSKKALAGQLYIAGGFQYICVAENVITRLGIQALFTTAVGSTGTAPNWSISSVEMGNTLTLNIPLAAATVTSGTISNAAQTIAGAKTFSGLLTLSAGLTITTTGTQGLFIAQTGSKNNAAALQIDSTTQVVLFPRMTLSQANAITTAPDYSMVTITDAGSEGLYIRISGTWRRIQYI